ncbi:hypothetical protein GCM10010495_76140 [Kitasatospora herbaricolor]|uniref:hypothetical protein n=1 Tax=Kitasatospora herbaricolor TaxID=68217 RepID=UPI001748BA4D|nr:hypothetical protein [Kitasatospora herbaricolor]MDQ0305619.1 hypothetical protein [Kitasatospora herbaricolor]GGV47205.1 hypothetical protein GCM10010495_76140 [Kitasatospora herbaricolor]
MGPRRSGDGSGEGAPAAEFAAEQARAYGMRLLDDGGLLEQLARQLLQQTAELVVNLGPSEYQPWPLRVR